jgi:hypothetical protein
MHATPPIHQNLAHMTGLLSNKIKCCPHACCGGIQGEYQGTVLLIHPNARQRWVVGFTPQPLYPQGRSAGIPLQRRMGWVPELVWMFWRWEKKSLLHLQGIALQTISLRYLSSSQQCPIIVTNYEAPHTIIFSTFLSLFLPAVQTLSSACTVMTFVFYSLQ